jgi:hypothetical protein
MGLSPSAEEFVSRCGPDDARPPTPAVMRINWSIFATKPTMSLSIWSEHRAQTLPPSAKERADSFRVILNVGLSGQVWLNRIGWLLGQLIARQRMRGLTFNGATASRPIVNLQKNPFNHQLFRSFRRGSSAGSGLPRASANCNY